MIYYYYLCHSLCLCYCLFWGLHIFTPCRPFLFGSMTVVSYSHICLSFPKIILLPHFPASFCIVLKHCFGAGTHGSTATSPRHMGAFLEAFDFALLGPIRSGLFAHLRQMVIPSQHAFVPALFGESLSVVTSAPGIVPCAPTTSIQPLPTLSPQMLLLLPLLFPPTLL